MVGFIDFRGVSKKGKQDRLYEKSLAPLKEKEIFLLKEEVLFHVYQDHGVTVKVKPQLVSKVTSFFVRRVKKAISISEAG